MTRTPMIDRLSRRHGRRLPFCGDCGGPVTVPGLGTFAYVSVGNTSHATGLDAYFHPEGALEPAAGFRRHHAVIGPDLRMGWALGHDSLDYGDHDGRRFGAAVFEPIGAHVEALHGRAPVSWAFHFDSAAAMEAKRWLRPIEETGRHIGNRRRDIARGRAWPGLTPEGMAEEPGREETRLAVLEARAAPRLRALRALRDAWRDRSGGGRPMAGIRDAFDAALRGAAA